MSYTDQIEVLDEKIEGIGPWMWIKDDYDCFDLIRLELERSHTQIWGTIMEFWEKNVSPSHVALQAGGCCGMYPRLLKERYHAVYTFEPDPLSFFCLVNNCPDDYIIKINAALGNERNLIAWNRVVGNAGMSHKSDEGEPLIPMFKVDDLHLITLNLLALDCEGYESEIVKGASETIERCQPLIILENGNPEFMKNFDYLPVAQSCLDVIFMPKHICEKFEVTEIEVKEKHRI